MCGWILRFSILTVWRVLTRQGISAEGEATMGEFLGESEVQKWRVFDMREEDRISYSVRAGFH
jgi:hypothetical protein